MEFTKEDLRLFVDQIWSDTMSANQGGMGAPDLFSLWFVLRKYSPKVVVESGVWNGISTKLIRKTLPDSTILCLDPRPVPSDGFTDPSENTIYYTGKKFRDFNDLDLSSYNPDDILCFFDCHQNAFKRVLACLRKKITKIFLNDNYPTNCGSHYTMEHMKQGDSRFYKVTDSIRERVLKMIDTYHIFPNIYPGPIRTGEGLFQCESYFSSDNQDPNYAIFR